MSINIEKIRATVEPIIQDLGYNLYDIEYYSGNRIILRIYIYRSNDPISLDDCVKVSNLLDPIFEQDDYGPIFLEVSSAGITRKLKKKDHFINSVGSSISLSLKGDNIPFKSSPLLKLVAADEDAIEVIKDQQRFTIPYNNIAKGRLELDEE